MKRIRLYLVVGLILFLPSATAFGALIPRAALVANPPTTPFLPPEGVLAAPWQSYQLSLQATAGEIVRAVDVTIDGPLHQRWQESDLDGVPDPSPNGPPSDGRGDSHLTAPAGSPLGLAPSETNSKTGSPLVSDPGNREYGLGGMRGAWGLLNPQPVTNLAYIVVRSDQIKELQITVLSADGNGNLFPTFRAADFFPPIPEPATFTMVGLALLAAARTRTRTPKCARRSSQAIRLMPTHHRDFVKRIGRLTPVRSALMIKLTQACVIGLLLLMPSSSAFGALIARATLVANPPTTPFLPPEAALPAPWRSYQLSFQATAGELVNAVDVKIDGPLHQRWIDIDFNGVVDPSPNGLPSNGRGDSHLTVPVPVPVAVGPNETNSKSGSPLVSTPGNLEYGLGGLRGAWGMENPQALTNLAYIVVRADQIPQLQITVESADPSGRPFRIFRAVDFFPPIPEPATFTMVGFAMLAAARLRFRTRSIGPRS